MIQQISRTRHQEYSPSSCLQKPNKLSTIDFEVENKISNYIN